MRIITPVLAGFLCVQSFGLPIQRAEAFIQNNREPQTDDLRNSDLFLQQATHVSTKPTREQKLRVEALLARMTLEEKIGQMTNLVIDTITTGKDQDIRVDPAKLEKAILKYGVGSFQNVNNQALPAEKWREIIGQIQETSQKTRLGIPNIYGIDSIHGANYVRGSTLFPQEIGMAATWNPALMQRAAEIAAAETRAAGIPWSFSPVLDVGRQPLWPRLWETFGEDTYFFFSSRRRHTRWNCDWSSDMCSSDLKAQRSDMQPSGQQRGRRDVEPEIADGEIGAVAVGDVDPLDLQTERHEPVEPLHRHSEPRAGHALDDGPLQPRLPRLGLQQAKSREEDHDQHAERDTEPAKQS